MSRTLRLTVALSLIASTQLIVTSVSAQIKAPAKLSFFKSVWPEKGIDLRFSTALGVSAVVGIPVGWIVGEALVPHAIKGICAMEDSLFERQTLLAKPETCNLYYGDPKVNSCLVSDNTVVIRVRKTPATFLKFMGVFDGLKLAEIQEHTTQIDDNKKESLIGLPTIVKMDLEKGTVVNIQHGQSQTAVAPEDVAAQLSADEDFYNQMALLLRAAYVDCKDGMYEASVERLVQSNPEWFQGLN